MCTYTGGREASTCARCSLTIVFGRVPGPVPKYGALKTTIPSCAAHPTPGARRNSSSSRSSSRQELYRLPQRDQSAERPPGSGRRCARRQIEGRRQGADRQLRRRRDPVQERRKQEERRGAISIGSARGASRRPLAWTHQRQWRAADIVLEMKQAGGALFRCRIEHGG